MSRCTLFFLILLNLKEYKNVLLRGTRAGVDQFPWLVQFQTIAPCGGVLVSPDWVLTAAQCVQDKRNSIVVLARGLNGTGSTQEISVKATYIFPQYQAYSTSHDRDHNIALLKLMQPFDMYNAKVVLPDIASINLGDGYKSCHIFGWQSYVSPFSKILAKPIQYSEVILNSWKLCVYMIKGDTNYTNVFCTMVEFKDDMRACSGNPGSPVVCKNRYHKIVLLGIASWTNFSLDCGDLPTYLDISIFRKWIYDLIFNNEKVTEQGAEHKKYLEGTKPHSQLFQDHIPNFDSSDVQNDVYPLILNSNDYIKLTSLYNPYTKILKGDKDTIQRYQEVGKTKKALNNNNKIVERSNNPEEADYFDEPSSTRNRKLDKFLAEHKDDQEDDMDEFEFLYPLNLEDAITSNHVVRTCSVSLIFLSLGHVYFFHRTFYW